MRVAISHNSSDMGLTVPVAISTVINRPDTPEPVLVISVNAIFVPSGDHAELEPIATVPRRETTTRSVRPSLSATTTAVSSRALNLVNAISFPSGEKVTELMPSPDKTLVGGVPPIVGIRNTDTG